MKTELPLSYIREPRDYGNPTVFAERLSEAYVRPENDLWRPVLEKEFSEALSEERLTSQELAAIRGAVSRIRSLKARAKCLQPRSGTDDPRRSGRASALFVVQAARDPFGVVQDVRVMAKPDGGGTWGLWPEKYIKDFAEAILVARLAAVHACIGIGFSADAARVLPGYSYEFQIGKVEREMDGRSIGLAAAMAVMSCLYDKEISRPLAFTGEVAINGDIIKVDGVPEKVKAAHLKGLASLIPADNLEDVPKNLTDAVIPVAHLDDAVQQVFSFDARNDLFVRLCGTCASPAPPREPEVPSPAGKALLLSVVGERDPFPLEQLPELPGMLKGDGPIPTAARWLRPGGVILLPTRKTEPRSNLTKLLLQEMLPECRIEIEPLDVGDDPTNYDKIFAELRRGLLKWGDILAQFPPSDTYLSISSGTPQMHAVWLKLITGGFLNARLLQVREPRYAKGGPRINIVHSTALGF